MHVVIASSPLRYLNNATIDSLNKIMALGADISIGDGPADRLVQGYLKYKGYRRVRVHSAYGKVVVNRGFRTVRGYKSYKARDRAMCDLADYALVLWNGKGEYTAEIALMMGDRAKVISYN